MTEWFGLAPLSRAAALGILLGWTALPSQASTVAEIQQYLADKGCEPGQVDGEWGGSSRRAAARYAEITGTEIGSDTDLAALPPELVEADCSADIDIGPADVHPPYTTPERTIALPVGITQYDWIPAELQDFEWRKATVPFVDLAARSAAFNDEQKRLLGCNTEAVRDGISRVSDVSEVPTDFDHMANSDFIGQLNELLPAVFCTGGMFHLDGAVRVLDKWAKGGAFLGYGLREKARAEYEDPSIIPDEYVGRSFVVGTTLAYREVITQILVVWSIAKYTVTIDPEQVERIEAWLAQVVQEQAFSYSDMPLDCPSFDDLPYADAINEGRVMRWDQFEECINTGTSRAGVSALWAMISGDRGYALDALNTYVMALHMLRSDGSHILESVRERNAHYKAVYNVAWMVVVAEAFARSGLDIYDLEVQGRSIFSHMSFLAKSAVDEELRFHYARNPKPEYRIEIKDPWHWIPLIRDGHKRTVQLIKREIAGTPDRDEVLKLFNVFKTRSKIEEDRDALLPFTLFLVPPNFMDYMPEDTRSELQ